MPNSEGPARRGFLTGLALAGAAGCAAGSGTSETKAATDPRVAAEGRTQAGIDRPPTPQRHIEALVFDLRAPAEVREQARRVLPRLGKRILALTSGADPLLAALAPGDLTVTAGIGPRLRPGLEQLPEFARERIAPEHRGGDLFVQVCASDPMVAALAASAVQTSLGETVRLRWRQAGFQGPAPDGVGRNLLGFPDGIVLPKTEEEFARNVWLANGETVAVVRRLRIDVARFMALPVAEQERVIGRRRADGAALSGGGPHGEADLLAKAPDGQWLIPADAHIRRSNALATGSATMLRRSYNFDNGAGDRGLLFIGFQRDRRTYTETQARMDESDRLMEFTTATASGIFQILPGFTADRPWRL